MLCKCCAVLCHVERAVLRVCGMSCRAALSSCSVNYSILLLWRVNWWRRNTGVQLGPASHGAASSARGSSDAICTTVVVTGGNHRAVQCTVSAAAAGGCGDGAQGVVLGDS